MKPRAGCTFRCIAMLLGTGIGMMLFGTLLLAQAANWLRNEDQAEQADAIVVLAGPPERALHAADLYKAGLATRILVSIPVRESSLKVLDKLGIPAPRAEATTALILTRSGVPEARIGFFGKGSTSTYDEAKALSALAEGTRLTLLVVTSPYHVRRAAMILKDVAGKNMEKITVVGTPYEDFPVRWWSSQDSARNVLLELAKIVFYRFGGKFEAAGNGT